LVRIGGISDEDARIAEVTAAAFGAVLNAPSPGARDAYAVWQGIVDASGLTHYRRHHCGYCVGIGQPPSWTGGNRVTGLRHNSELEIETGMTFHILSWLMGTGQGDHFASNTVLLTEMGAEVLITTPAGVIVSQSVTAREEDVRARELRSRPAQATTLRTKRHVYPPDSVSIHHRASPAVFVTSRSVSLVPIG
jgi:hypothetical protein